MNSFEQWLAEIGLENYVATFIENEIDFSVAGTLTEADLRELGLSLGSRKKFLLAAASLAKPATANQDVGRVQPAEQNPTPSAAQSAAVGGERRQLTVMFCDLVGSTALSEKLDPEELRSLLHDYRTRCGAVISRYDGFVARYVGDGILTYFGWPTAHEDDAERAIRAALEITQTIKQASITETLSVRIGIATGPVVVGEQAGVGDQSKLAIGSTPNLAARLQGLAAADQIIVAASTRRLIGNAFDLADLGEQVLKGISDPVHAWRVVAVGEAASRFEASHGGQLTPMVGRDQEVGLLLERWELARSDEGQVVLLSGEPGIGKSRMLRAFRERLGKGIEIALQYQCSPYYTNTALYPIIDHLERNLGFQRKDSNDQKLDKLEQRLLSELGRNRTECQLIGEMLSLSCQERYEKLNLSPQRQKDDTLHALTEIIAVVAKQQATVVLFEDIHWADPTTLEALNILIDRTESLPILVLLAYRPEFQPPWLSRAHVTPIALTRLSRTQSASIVLRVAGGKPLPSDLVLQIVDKTDGVPLFLEELSKAVLESDMLIDKGDRYDYSGSVSKMAIPATLHDSLMARLDRLIPVKEIAQVGAALGREFSYELLSAVSPMQEPELSEALNKLVQSELVFRRGAPPNQTYVFKHALVQDAAYDSLLKSKRQTLHAQIAAAIRERFPQKAETEPELLAHHYAEAGQDAEAVPRWFEAAKRALSRVALAEAVGHLTNALECNNRIPSNIERDREELEIRLLLGTTYLGYLGHASQKVIDALEPARHLAVRLGRDDHLVPILFHLWMINTVRCDFDAGLKLVDELRELAKRTGDSYDYMVACNVECETHCWMGNFARAREAAERGLKFYDPAKHAHLVNIYNHDQRCGILVWMVHFLWILGYPDQAQMAAQHQLDWARHLGHVFNLCFSLTQGNSALTLRGDISEARAWAAEADAIGREHAMGYITGFFVPVFDAFAMIAGGEFAEGLAKLPKSWAIYEASGGILLDPLENMMRGQALIGLGRPEEARQLLTKTIAIIERTGHRMHEAEIHRVLGETYPTDGVAAERNFLKAIEVSRAQSAKGFELRAAMSLARLWQQEGKQSEARELLAPIYNWFTEGFDTRDLRDAKSLLERLN